MTRAVLYFGAAHALRQLRALALAAPRPGDKPGPRCSANSAAAVGAGHGVPNPMSPVALPVPGAIVPAANATAQGIVTRMGQDASRLGGAAIEPGAEGMRPASAEPRNRAAWLSIGDFLATQNLRRVLAGRAAAAGLSAGARKRSAGAGAGTAGAQAFPVGNHGDNNLQQSPGTLEQSE